MKNLISALVKFQKEVPTIPKNKVNPFFNSLYAELSTVIDTCSPSLNKHGLAVIQTIKAIEGKNILVTMLCHESGETLESYIYLPDINDPQKLTSAITYLRRSTYLAITGLVADSDDDGNSVSNQTQKVNNQVNNKVNNNTQKTNLSVQNNLLASDAQKNALTKMGIYYSNDITKSEASKLIELANKKKGN